MLHMQLPVIFRQALIAWYKSAAEHYRLTKPMDLKIAAPTGFCFELTALPTATPFELQQQIDGLGGIPDIPLNRLALIFEEKDILAPDARDVPLYDLNVRSGDRILAAFDNSPEALIGGAFSVSSTQVFAEGIVGVLGLRTSLGLNSPCIRNTCATHGYPAKLTPASNIPIQATRASGVDRFPSQAEIMRQPIRVRNDILKKKQEYDSLYQRGGADGDRVRARRLQLAREVTAYCELGWLLWAEVSCACVCKSLRFAHKKHGHRT